MLTAANIQLIALYSICCVGFNTTLWGIATKYRLHEWYQAKRTQRMPEEWCYICISFWAAVIYTVPIACFTGLWLLLAAPFIAAGPTIKLAFK